MAGDGTAAILTVDNVTKSFGGLHAVDGCSLSVAEGSMTGLIGPNGARKTTLFNLVTGFIEPDSGRILLRDNRIDHLPPHHIFRKGLLRTFQVPRELKGMTVLENLMLVPPGQAGETVWNSWLFRNRVARQEEANFAKELEVLDFVEIVNLRDGFDARLYVGQ